MTKCDAVMAKLQLSSQVKAKKAHRQQRRKPTKYFAIRHEQWDVVLGSSRLEVKTATLIDILPLELTSSCHCELAKTI